MTEFFGISSTSGVVVNDGNSSACDFRVETDLTVGVTPTHFIFVDSSVSRMNLGHTNSTTTYKTMNFLTYNTSTTYTGNIGVGASTTTPYGILVRNMANTSNSYVNIDLVAGTTSSTYYDCQSAMRIAWRGWGTTSTSYTSYNYLSFLMHESSSTTPNHLEQFRFQRNGDFHAEGNVIAYSSTISSDVRLKENIETIEESSLDKIMSLRPVNFEWKAQKRKGKYKNSGFIAQEVEEIIPNVIEETIKLNDESNENLENETMYKHIKYNELVPYLTHAIQEQQKEIKGLKEEIDKLKNK
jgi:hypothetical protein